MRKARVAWHFGRTLARFWPMWRSTDGRFKYIVVPPPEITSEDGELWFAGERLLGADIYFSDGYEVGTLSVSASRERSAECILEWAPKDAALARVRLETGQGSLRQGDLERWMKAFADFGFLRDRGRKRFARRIAAMASRPSFGRRFLARDA